MRVQLESKGRQKKETVKGLNCNADRTYYSYAFTNRPDVVLEVTGTPVRPQRTRRVRKSSNTNGGSGKELLFFTVFLVVVMITLSQVLVVHHKYNGRYGQVARPHSNRMKAQQELRQVERIIAALRRQNIPSPQQAADWLQQHIYASRIASLIQRASNESRTVLQHNLRSVQNHSLFSQLPSTLSSSLPSSAMTSTVFSSILLSALDCCENTSRTHLHNTSGIRVGNITTNNFSDPIFSYSVDGTSLENITNSLLSQLCPEEPPGLLGNLSRDVNHEHDTLTLSQVIASHLDIQLGGEWRPLECIARYRVALVIPYRDRLAHLTVLLAHLLPILKRQQLHFRVFVVEQYGSNTFNKGRIMNAAFKEALKLFDFQCVVFHDVDLIPEDDRNMYSCPIMPRHLSVAIDEMNYRLAYSMLVGGVLNMRVEHFQQANGYSNMYWGWGAEDDDMAYRILHVGLKIFRPPSNIARYQMIRHKKREPASWGIRNKLLTTAVKRYQLDGLNSVKYTVQFIHADQLFTHIMVDIGKPDIKAQR